MTCVLNFSGQAGDDLYLELSHFSVRNLVLVTIVKVLAAHSPDEHIVAGSCSCVDRPLRRCDCLLVLHPYESLLLRLSHQMADRVAWLYVEVEICLHAACVSVSRHCVPY